MKRATSILAALGLGIVIGATYSFALQAKTTRGTVEVMLAKLGPTAPRDIKSSRIPSDGDRLPGESLIEQVERTGEAHFTKPA